MCVQVVSAGLASLFLLIPVACGHAPARSQDFSITNQLPPADANRRDVLRQLQAWWDVHGYYPRHASQNNESGNVRLHLVILTDGRIRTIDVAGSSGSDSLDAAGVAAFGAGFVRPFPPGAPELALDLTLHYVLAQRHDQPVAASATPARSTAAFTITNEPVRSPILDTMLLKTCTGTVVKEGIRNHPAYGGRHWAQAVFFRRPDNTPWVRFYEGGETILAPVTEVGKIVHWVGHVEHPRKNVDFFYEYNVWPEGDNALTGSIEASPSGLLSGFNRGGTVDFTCASESVPAIEWSALFVIKEGPVPTSDPP